MVLALRPEGEDVQEVTVKETQNNHGFVEDRLVQVKETIFLFYLTHIL